MDVTRRAFGTGLAGLVGALFPPRKTEANEPVNLLEAPKKDEYLRNDSSVSLVGRLEGEATIKAYPNGNGGWGHRLFTQLKIERDHLAAILRHCGREHQHVFDVIALVAWGDKAQAIYGLVESGKLPPGTKVHVMGTVVHERNGTTEWINIHINRMGVVS